MAASNGPVSWAGTRSWYVTVKHGALQQVGCHPLVSQSEPAAAIHVTYCVAPTLLKKKKTNQSGTKHSTPLRNRWFRSCLGTVGLGQPKLGLPCPLFITSSQGLSAAFFSSILNQPCKFLALRIIFRLKFFFCNFEPIPLILVTWQSWSCCCQDK